MIFPRRSTAEKLSFVFRQNKFAVCSMQKAINNNSLFATATKAVIKKLAPRVGTLTSVL